jgi:hypothetical protein
MVELSDTDLILDFVFEGGLILKGVINRIHAPLLVEEIKFLLPFQGRAAMIRGEMKITLGITKGNAKPTKEVKRADIAYQPLGDTLDIYLNDGSTFSQVNILGKITSDETELDELTKVRRGSPVTIQLAK